MAITILRIEGPPESGKSVEAFSYLYSAGLSIPSGDPDREDVAQSEALWFVGGGAFGSEIQRKIEYPGIEETKDAIAQEMADVRTTTKARALILEHARRLYRFAGEDAGEVLDYLRATAEREGFEWLIFEDVEPSVHDEEARKIFDDRDWLRAADTKTMPVATPLGVYPLVSQTILRDVSTEVIFPLSQMRALCDAGGWRLGPVCRIATDAMKLRLSKGRQDGKAGGVVTGDDIREALCLALAERHAVHSEWMRSRLLRSPQYAEPLCSAVARFAHEGGVQPTGETVKRAITEQRAGAGLPEQSPSNGAVWRAARSLIDDETLWLGSDGRALIGDALFGVRLLNPELHQAVEERMRQERSQSAAAAVAHQIETHSRGR